MLFQFLLSGSGANKLDAGPVKSWTRRPLLCSGNGVHRGVADWTDLAASGYQADFLSPRSLAPTVGLADHGSGTTCGTIPSVHLFLTGSRWLALSLINAGRGEGTDA